MKFLDFNPNTIDVKAVLNLTGFKLSFCMVEQLVK